MDKSGLSIPSRVFGTDLDFHGFEPALKVNTNRIQSLGRGLFYPKNPHRQIGRRNNVYSTVVCRGTRVMYSRSTTGVKSLISEPAADKVDRGQPRFARKTVT